MSNVYIDPSELKSNSKFSECITIEDELNFHPLPELEERTGADMMISPSGLPHPVTDFLLKRHIESGAIHVQLKFGHDLVSSFIDGRYKACQEKMIATGANFDQIVLLFIGHVIDAKDDDHLMIDGQWAGDVNPLAKNFKYTHYLQQRIMWSKRGGVFEQIGLRRTLKKWIECQQAVIKECKVNPVRNVWESRQKLFLIDDWRNMLFSLPGLGEKKIEAIYDKLENKSWYGFMEALENDKLLEVDGIGPSIIQNIKNYLGEK